MKFKCLHLTSQLHLAGFLNSRARGLSGSLLSRGNFIICACLSITCSSGPHEHKYYTIIAVKRGRHKYFKSWEVFCDAGGLSRYHARGRPTESFIAWLFQLSDLKEKQKQLQFIDLRAKGKGKGGVCMHVHGWRWLIDVQRHISMPSSVFKQSLVPRREETFSFFFFHIGTLQAKIR